MDEDAAKLTKKCSRCGETKPIGSDFSIIRQGNGALRAYSYCRQCSTEYGRDRALRKVSGDLEDRRKRRACSPEPIARECSDCGLIMTVEGNFYRMPRRRGSQAWSYTCIQCSRAKAREWHRAKARGEQPPSSKRGPKPKLKPLNGLFEALREEARERANAGPQVGPGYIKRCPKCGESKIAEAAFHRSKRRPDGFDAYCKACYAKRHKERKATDPERLRERGRRSNARWVERNPDKVAQANKRHCELAKARTREARANPPLEAVCMDCGETKPRSAFVPHSHRADGLHKRCDVCRKERRDRTAKAHRERNRDSIRERLSARRKSERHKEWERQHRQKPHIRETMRLRDQLRNGRMRDVPVEGKITRREWLAIRAAFNDCCCYCDKPARMTLEHLTPLARGGKNEVGNIAPACFKCNSSKRDRTAEEFAPLRAADIRRKAAIHGGEVPEPQPTLFDWSSDIGRRTEGG